MSPAEWEAFVDRFAEGWRLPKPDAFLQHFLPLLDENVVLSQPFGGPVRGRAAFERLFRGLFGLIPDAVGEVESWAAEGDILFMDLRISGTVGRRRVDLPTRDRLVVRDSRIVQRDACAELWPLLGAIAAQPKTWPRSLRAVRALRRGA